LVGLAMLDAWVSVALRVDALTAWMALALVTAVTLTRITAPYGRHVRQGWGPALPATWSWMVMESVSSVIVLACFVRSSHRTAEAWIFVAVFCGHYAYRSFVYPFLGDAIKSRAPLSISAMASVFNLINGCVIGAALYGTVEGPPQASVSMAVGGVLVIVGFTTHVWADSVLRNLRSEKGPGYHVPEGGLFRYVSCPNYLGEIVQWVGFAWMTMSLGGACFAVWTAANLAPRAMAHHRWYRAQFPQYPPDRRALVPWLV